MVQFRKDRLFAFINNTILALLGVMTLYPFIHIVSVSLSGGYYVTRNEVSFYIKDFTLLAYHTVFQNGAIVESLLNSILYTVFGTLWALILTIPAAYTLTKKIAGEAVIMKIFTVPLYIAGGLIPTYLLIHALKMTDTVWAMIILGGLNSFYFVITRAYFIGQETKEIEESGAIDGLSPIGVFLRLILPLSMPIIATIGLFYAVARWNDWFSAMIYLNNDHLFPVQLVLRNLVITQSSSVDFSMNFGQTSAVALLSVEYAAIVIATLPIIIIFPFLQKFFAQGMMMGSVKG